MVQQTPITKALPCAKQGQCARTTCGAVGGFRFASPNLQKTRINDMTQRTRFAAATSVTDTWAFTYNNGNEQLSTTLDGGRLDLRYDPLGRLATLSAVIGGQTYTATYTWWFDDKLKRIDSNFPGETAVVTYNYDGLGKRRWRQGPTFADTCWRWDTGYSVLTEHNGTGGLWSAVGDFRAIMEKCRRLQNEVSLVYCAYYRYFCCCYNN